MLLAYEIAEREDDPERRRRLLTFVVVGGGPTGVEMAGAIAEIAQPHAGPRLPHDLDGDRRASLLIEAGPSILSTFPEDLRQARAPIPRAAARRGPGPTRA